jgi:hypothetical protein
VTDIIKDRPGIKPAGDKEREYLMSALRQASARARLVTNTLDTVGVSNPNGRPTARSRLTERFIADVSLTWEQHGSAVLQKMATKEPTRFADMCSRLIPRDVTLSLEARLPGNLDPNDWAIVLEVMSAVKQILPDANSRAPGEVLQLVASALRAYGAKPIVDNRDSD